MLVRIGVVALALLSLWSCQVEGPVSRSRSGNATVTQALEPGACDPTMAANCGAFGCGCADGQCSGGFCPGTGCSASLTSACAAFGCGCADGQCSGGFCPGTGCTVRERSDCERQGRSCALHACQAPLTRAVVSPSFAQLASQLPDCSAQSPASLACRAASSRFCRSLGFVSGFGPIEASPTGAQVLCLGGPDVVPLLTQFTVLDDSQPSCSANSSMSNACSSAINRFCLARGFAAGGFGPEEQNGNDVLISCVRGPKARQVSTPMTQIAAFFPNCPAVGFNNLECRAAVNRTCQTLGYASGFGPFEQSSTHVTHACVERAPEPITTDPRLASANLSSGAWSARAKRPLTLTSCNATRYAQVPGRPDHFVGRTLTGPDCNGVFKLAVYRRQGDVLALGSDIVGPGARIRAGDDGALHQLDSAYDPAVFAFRGETWLAFECTGRRVGGGPNAFGPAPGVCAGPLDAQRFTLDLDRTTLVVKSVSLPNGQLISASVPKLLLHQGRGYLYWDAVRIQVTPSIRFLEIVTRGVELQREFTGGNRLLAKQQRAAITTNHRDATLVWGTGPAPRFDTVADMFDVRSDGRYVYASAGLGGAGCGTPLDPVDGCYRLAIARTLKPLAQREFERSIIDDSLPDNPNEYATFVTRPDGGLSIIAQFLTPRRAGAPIAAGFQEIDLAPPQPASTLANVCDPTLQPFPTWNVRLGACLPSCASIGGQLASSVSCDSVGRQSAGAAWDGEYCCL